MKRLLAVAAVVLASSAAQAQYVIEYGGKTIRIDPDRGTVQIPGVYDNTEQKKPKRAKRDQDTAARPQPGADKPAQAPAEAAVTPSTPAQAPAASPPAAVPAAPAPTAAVPVSPPPAPVAPAPVAPAPVQAAVPSAAVAAPAAPAPAAAPLTPPAGAPTVAAPVAPPPAAVQPQPRPAQAPATVATTVAPPPSVRDQNSPVGIWLTEEKEGKIRIEPCGANLCGYSIDAKTNQNGEQILINMRPNDKEKKWSGRIFDPSSGSTYDSTIALKGPDSLRVQGCAFGGMFCGGQTWTRVN
uniref:DUF2147 domain-containing protein n=1 Tax=Bradyrhizobium sp. (strain ORS 278) TaxID=114615 RepID=UPI000322ECFB|nr:DUF2147 domain-containing protein [Bradyrhizobium sp. ORS 278]